MRRGRVVSAAVALPLALAACDSGEYSEYASPVPVASASAPESPAAGGEQKLCTVVNEAGEIIALDSLPLQDLGSVAIHDELANETSEGDVRVVQLDGTTDHRLAVEFPLANRTRLDKIYLNFRVVTAEDVTLDVRVGRPCHTGNAGDTQYYTTIAP